MAAGLSAVAADINSLARQVVANNPSASAMLENIKASRLDMKAQNQLEAPELEVEHMFGEKGVHDKTGVSLTQSFDWPGAYRARSQASDASAEAMERLRQGSILDLTLEAKMVMLEIINTRQRLALVDSISANVERITAHTDEGFAHGIFTRLDVNRMKIERIQIADRRTALENRLGELEENLRGLNGGKDVSEIMKNLESFPIERLENLDTYLAAVETSDPSLAASKLSAESSRLASKAENLSRLPGWSLGYRYSREEGHSFNGFSVGMTLPFLRKNYSGKSAKSAAAASGFEYEAMLAQRQAEVRSLYNQALRLAQSNREYSQVFDQSNNIALLTKAYKGGQLNSVSYLNDINYFLDANEAYIESLYNYAATLARLNKYSLL